MLPAHSSFSSTCHRVPNTIGNLFGSDRRSGPVERQLRLRLRRGERPSVVSRFLRYESLYFFHHRLLSVHEQLSRIKEQVCHLLTVGTDNIRHGSIVDSDNAHGSRDTFRQGPSHHTSVRSWTLVSVLSTARYKTPPHCVCPSEFP